MRKPKARFGKLQQITDGQVHRYHVRKDGRAVLYTVCCDCGLTHLEELIPRKGYIRVRVWRAEEWTKKIRGKRRVVGRKR